MLVLSMKLLVVLAVVATIACALPTPDDIMLEQVPAPELAPQVIALQTRSSGPREAAVRAYRLLQQNGNDDAACRALANSMIAEVNTTVSTAQANIDAVDDGSDCGSRYQDEVTAAQTANTNAQNALTEAQTALTTASSASVTLTQAYTVDPAVTYFTNNPAWVEASGNYEQAQTALSTAQGTATTTATAYTTAQATQTTEINTCRCTAQSALATAVANNANNNNAATNTANWNQAHNLLCVLDNTNPCNFAPAPTVTARTLPADVSAATCSGGSDASGPCPAGYNNRQVDIRGITGAARHAEATTVEACDAACTARSCIGFEYHASRGSAGRTDACYTNTNPAAVSSNAQAAGWITCLKDEANQ